MAELDLVAREVTAHCLEGMARAADVLVGDEAQRVCETFAGWLGEARRTWPWLPGLCFDALAPLGVAFPAHDPTAVVLGRLLVAAETEAVAVRAALVELSALRDGDRPAGASGTGPIGTPPDAAGALRVRRLVAAVDGFWSELVRGAGAAHEPVVQRDRATADRVISQTRRRLEDIAEEVAWLAAIVAQPEPRPALQPHPEPQPQRDVAAPPPAAAAPSAAPEGASPTSAASLGPALPASPTLPQASPLPPATPVPAGSSALPAAPVRPAPPATDLHPTTRLDGAHDASATGPLPRPSAAPPQRPDRRGSSASTRTRPVPPPQRSSRTGGSPKDRTWEPIVFLVLAVAAAVAVLVRVGGL